jgi:two-component system, cell cycle sensor histidine kinase and response regulator CckA
MAAGNNGGRRETFDTSDGGTDVTPEAERIVDLDPKVILVAEDDPAISQLIVTTLERHGYRVLTAPDGREALRLIQAEDIAIDVLVSDIAMPGVGGLELVAKARAARPGLALVMMSGTNRLELRSTAIGRDVTLLEKPFSLADLTKTIDAAIARGSPDSDPLP